MATSFRQIIDKAVKDKRFLVVPGAHDALSARLIQTIGFETFSSAAAGRAKVAPKCMPWNKGNLTAWCGDWFAAVPDVVSNTVRFVPASSP